VHDARHNDREVFYRRGALPAPYEHSFLKVVGEFADPEAPLGEGRVVTAFPTHRVRPGEQQRWP